MMNFVIIILQLRSKKELIRNFINSINVGTSINDDWNEFVNKQYNIDMKDLIAKEKLKPVEAKKFINNSFRDGVLKTTGTDIDKILPPISRFGGARIKKKQNVIEKLTAFFEKYFDIVNPREVMQDK